MGDEWEMINARNRGYLLSPASFCYPVLKYAQAEALISR
jgi:hypothetical protein